jgi:3-(3-hydroxy-phenyl)propionate hydroxylase
MNSPFSPEVVIVGAGPCGLTLANLLGTLGVRTLLIEQHASTVSEPRAVTVDDESLRTMQSVGLAEIVSADVLPGGGVQYHSQFGEPFARVWPSVQEYGYARRNSFQQYIFEAQLREGLKRFPNVETRFETVMEGFTQDAEGVTVQLSDARGKSEVRAAFLAGCDGARSKVRHILGIELKGRTHEERWLIVDVAGTPARFRNAQVFCDPRRPCITLPGPHGTRRYEFMLLPGEKDEDVLPEPVARAMIERYIPADKGVQIVRKLVYTFHARIADRWREGRVFISGDAAHLTPPFVGQGMNSGIRDAHNLSWKLAAVLRGQFGLSLLDTYKEERKDHAWALIEMAISTGFFMQPKSWLSAFLMQTAVRIASLYPPARDYLVQMKYKPKPRFEAGFILPDTLPPKISLSGRLFIQPRVETPGARGVRFDDAIGPGFTLLLYGPVPGETPRFPEVPAVLGARRIWVMPRDHLFPLEGKAEGVDALIRDDEGAIGAVLAPYGRCAVLLRPDRYVMAVIPLADPAPVTQALQGLIARHAA